MTNPDCEELVKLADAYEAGTAKCVASGYEEFGPAFQRERELVVTALRRLASSDGGVKVKPLVWRDHRPDSFPEPAWSAQTSFGFYNIEEVSASDSPAYVVRLHAHHFVADQDSLDDAKAAAQADYEARIKSALVEVPVVKGEPEPVAWQFRSENGKWIPCERPSPEEWLDEPEKFRRLYLAAPPADAGMREALEFYANEWLGSEGEGGKIEYEPTDRLLADQGDRADAALTAPGATTKSDGGDLDARFKRLEKEATDLGYVLTPEPEHPDSPHNSPSDPSSTRSDVTVDRQPPEWLWWGEVDGKDIVTFGRWPKRGARWRYKLAEIQPIEHDRAALEQEGK